MVTLILKKDTMIAYQFETVDDKIKLVSNVFYGFDTNKAIQNPEYFAEFLRFHFVSKDELKSESYTVLLDWADIQYRTVHFSNLELSMEGGGFSYEESLLTKARVSLPHEIVEIYPDLTASILAERKDGDGVTLTSAHVASDIVAAIKDAFVTVDLGLMAICPKIYGFFNALKPTPGFVLVDDEYYIAAMSYQGLYVWQKPAERMLSPEDEISFIQQEVTEHFTIDKANFSNYQYEDKEWLLRPEIDRTDQNFTDKELVAAFGSNLPPKDLYEAEHAEQQIVSTGDDGKQEKGSLKNAISKLRKLLDTDGTEKI